ncbi:peptidoglycan DD-metalloendopeptidase family protein [Sphingomonas endolithica]|uniref:peptidoglycan DD-metalloendopeptidase family protein n=1 Tax=Sphingomonas endolithica TaxID=2972485 RepID=UPI0021AF432A|nr:peptidoglycan DD-metalloendopeptidase family protein [Sphingomonas sp. ZFBP2030]
MRIALAALPLLAGCIPGGGERPAPSPSYDRPQPVRAPTDSGSDEVQTLPSPPPAWQARPVTADAQTIEASSYVVRPGDTLRAVADRTGAGSEAVARANGLVPPFTIRVGQRLEIPGGRYHLVRSGETGIAISRAYGIDWSRIVTANDLAEPYVLRVGMRVLIPGVTPGRTRLEERAAAFKLDVDDLVTGSSPAILATQRPAQPTTSPRRVLSPTTPVAEPARLRGGFIWPVQGRVVGQFGPGASGEKINGIKIAVPLDTPIKAAADGVVAYAGDEIAALGGLVIIKHGDAWTTVYGHASKLLVQRGQSVKRGQTIAISGDSGFADRPELHFELRKGRTPVNPIPQLPSS